MVLTITPSERAALQLLATGATSDAVAAHLGVQPREVDMWLAALFAKMGAASRTDALADAVRRGLVSPAPHTRRENVGLTEAWQDMLPRA